MITHSVLFIAKDLVHLQRIIKDETTNEEKLERLHEIQAINISQGECYTKKMIGTTQRVLIDHFSKRNQGSYWGKLITTELLNSKSQKIY